MRIVPGNARSAGARESQQDEFGFSDMEDRAFTAHGGVPAVVADGMGGLASGNPASTANRFSRPSGGSGVLGQWTEQDRQRPVPRVPPRSTDTLHTTTENFPFQSGHKGLTRAKK